MDTNKLILFANVAETLNFTKSGEKLGYTQSGVSHILKSLEKELGFSLFSRTNKKIALTSDAKAILPSVRALLSMEENLKQNINAVKGLQMGQLTIACFSSVCVHWLPGILNKFQKLYPNISINLMEGGTNQIVDWVKNDIADLGFFSKQKLGSLEWIPLYQDPLMAVTAKDYKKPASEAVSIEEFEGQKFVISSQGTDYDVHNVLAANNISPNLLFSCNDDQAMISMIAHHLGISIMPLLCLKGAEDIVAIHPLIPQSNRELGFAIKSNETLSIAASEFIGLTKDMLDTL